MINFLSRKPWSLLTVPYTCMTCMAHDKSFFMRFYFLPGELDKKLDEIDLKDNVEGCGNSSKSSSKHNVDPFDDLPPNKVIAMENY